MDLSDIKTTIFPRTRNPWTPEETQRAADFFSLLAEIERSVEQEQKEKNDD